MVNFEVHIAKAYHSSSKYMMLLSSKQKNTKGIKGVVTYLGAWAIYRRFQYGACMVMVLINAGAGDG
jgi:hypothetical protein